MMSPGWSLFTGTDLEPDWPFGDLAPMSYGMIMADPPWRFELYSERGEAKSAQRHYRTMTTDDICRLPVGALAARDAVLLLWCTWPMLDAGRLVLDAWGFRYVSGGAWIKRGASGKLAFGTGYRLRSACEPWLLGISGNPATPRTHRNVIEGPRRRHSEKPVAAYRWAESYLPAARRLELFSRTTRPGWDTWGDEVGKFDAISEGRAEAAE